MKIEHDVGLAIESDFPCILLTFARSKGLTRVVASLDNLYPGIRDAWVALDRIKIMKDNGFWCNISTRKTPFIIIPTREKHTSSTSVNFKELAGKIARTLRRRKLGTSVSLSLDHFEEENVDRGVALGFVDSLEAEGITVHLYPY